MLIHEIIKKLSNESSKKKKQEILKDNESLVLKNILISTYNSYVTYGIKKLELPDSVGINTIDNDFEIVQILLDQLASREITGNAARDAIKNVMKNFIFEDQLIIAKIINRDMEAGFSESTVNKVWNKLIPTFKVALAERYDKHPKLLTYDKTWLCSRKLDGLRCITIIINNQIKFYSRKGKEFKTLNVLEEEMKQIITQLDSEVEINNIVLDGEICLVNDKGEEDFQGIMKLIKKESIKNPKYKIFDVLTLEDFLNEKSETILTERLNFLNLYLKDHPSEYMEVLEQMPIDSEETFAEWNKKVVDFGWEGVMLRKNVGYEGKRTCNLLKVKKFFDAEYEVIDIITGDFNHSVAGEGQAKIEMMTAVKILHKGFEVKVGSGWSINQRKEFFAHPEKIIGKTINVSYFEETKNQNGGISLRFPTVKYIYENGRDT